MCSGDCENESPIFLCFSNNSVERQLPYDRLDTLQLFYYLSLEDGDKEFNYNENKALFNILNNHIKQPQCKV